MRVLLLHPEVARRSCSDCQAHLYDDRPGEFGSEPLRRGGLPVLRPAGTKPPCRLCPKIPEGASPEPASAVELSVKNAWALHHYRECKAVGAFPDDAIVRRNAGIIARVEEAVREIHEGRRSLSLYRNLFRC